MWSEEDYYMEQEQSQPIFMPPMARIPQIPPQQVAGNRRVYGALKTSQFASPRYSAPLRYTLISRQYPAPPLYPVAQHWEAQPAPLPETPRPQLFAITPLSPCADEPSAQTGSIVGASRTPPYRIPGEWRREAEPGISETLLGCAILLLIAVFALIVTYFLLV